MVKKQTLAEIALYGLLILFFFQLVADFVEAIYAFGLLGTSIPVEIISVLLFFSPLVLLLIPHGLQGWPLVLVGELMLVCRVTMPLLDTRGKMLVAGLGVACFLILLPSLLRDRQDRDPQSGGLVLGLGLTLALALSVLLRVLGSGSDVTTLGWWQAAAWLLALVAGALLLRLRTPAPAAAGTASGAAGPGRPLLWRTVGLCLGLAGVLVLCYFAFASPTVMARWTEASYLTIVSVVALVLCLFALLLAYRPHLFGRLSPGLVLLWNLVFVLALVLTILAHQISFPAAAGAYPLPEPPVTWLHRVPLFLTLFLFPVLLVDWLLFVQALVTSRPAPRALGAGFSLGALYLVLMVFAQVFTTVYDYIPVAGPLFRDKFWLVFLVAGLVPALPILLVGRASFHLAPAGRRPGPGRAFAGLVVFLAAATVAGALLTAARPPTTPTPRASLKIMTYNIQQGYSEQGLKNLDGQLALIREVSPDIIGLQESDTARIAGGNTDVVRYFADRLDMHAYYGPKTVPGTFGIALLSRVPIDNPRTFYMYSEGEQTAAIAAQVTAGGQTFDVFVTHLGNDGDLVQQQAILQEIAGKDRVILMGDFNFRPDTEQYRLTTATLADSWLVRWPGGTDSQGVDPARRIDHIFVSPGTRVLDSTYLAGPASDHPALTTTIAW